MEEACVTHIQYMHVHDSVFFLGNITNSDKIVFALNSDISKDSPQFTLTCISTGGPATTVTWTRDSVTVTEGTETMLVNGTTAVFNHTLTVTERLGGLYVCSVSNKVSPKESTAELNINGVQII